jgi:hypothetical protein
MVEMIRIIRNCDDVGITASHLDVFWREHRQAPEYKNIQVRREKDDRALIEYSLMGFYWSWDGTDQRSRISAPPYARIRFQALPGSGQKVRLCVSPLEPSDRLMYPREPVLSEQGVVEFFQLLIAHLRNEGFEVQEAESPAPTEEAAGRKPWEQIPDHNWDRKALELWCTGYTHREIGDKVGVTGKTVQNRMIDLRKFYGTEIVPYKKQLQQWWKAKDSG